MKAELAFLVVLGLAAPAAADEISPGDELCTVEAQAQGGARCEECTVSVADRTAGSPDPCAALRERGWTRRCSIGATVTRTVFCDRAASPESSSGGCRVSRGGGALGAWALAPLALILARRRRARSSLDRRRRGGGGQRRSSASSASGSSDSWRALAAERR